MYPRVAQENTCEFEPWTAFQNNLSVLRNVF